MDRARLSGYITALFAVEDDALRRARREAPRKGLPAFEVLPEEGRFLQFLVRACGARKAVEFGTLGGYSGIWIARGLVEGGRLISVEHNAHHAQVAREHFAAAGLADVVEVRVGEARQAMLGLAAEGPFDFVFIDVDKGGYPAYFAWALENVRLGGVIAAHNALCYGWVLETGALDESMRAMQAFNRQVAAQPRVISTIYPAGDGTLVAVKVA